jgi:hypothetical protein
MQPAQMIAVVLVLVIEELENVIVHLDIILPLVIAVSECALVMVLAEHMGSVI